GLASSSHRCSTPRRLRAPTASSSRPIPTRATRLRTARTWCRSTSWRVSSPWPSRCGSVPGRWSVLDRALAGRIKLVGLDVDGVPVLRQVALPIAVANAVAEVKEAAKVVTTASGGRGAVREVAELLLRARGEWPDILKRYFRESSDVAHGARRSR